METGKEAFRPSEHSVMLIDTCVRELTPEMEQLSDWFDSYSSNHKERIAFDLEIVEKYASREAKIIEFGSIPLMLTSALSKLSYDVTGIDISPERFISSINRIGLNIIKCDIEKQVLPLDDNVCDVVIFNELFEHLRINLIFTMREVFRVLKPNGILLLSTPNLRSLRGIRNFLFYNLSYSCSGDLYAEYDKLEKLGHMGHVREYTYEEVINFLEQIGFSVESLIFRGTPNSRIENIIVRIFPSLRPFVTYIGRKSS